MLVRFRALLAAAWAGFLLCIAFVAAPTAFAVLERAQAGSVVQRLFELDARLGLAAGLLLVMMERRLQRDGVSTGRAGSALGWNTVLPLVALATIVAGYYALQPMMEAAKAGQGALSFGALHGISMAFFALKGLAVLVLAWRVSRPAV